ncbi:hypothetical protein EBR56_10735, partial [bacterium]|nr:hypothetical protein [bacterium]
RFLFADGAEIRAASIRGVAAAQGVRETISGSRGALNLRSAADGRRFQATMDAFVRSIRSGEVLDESGILVRATRVAIMGRAAFLSGRPVGRDETLVADSLAFPGHQVGRGMNIVGV